MYAAILGRSPEEALALHDRALSLNPNLAIAWCFSGLAHSYIGRHEEGLARISQARRLSPSDPHGFFFDMALMMPHLMRGDYPDAVEAGRRAISSIPGSLGLQRIPLSPRPPRPAAGGAGDAGA